MEDTLKIGVVAGCFDVWHPGYVKMFKEINESCSELFILLHEDPSIERPEKFKPILSLQERREMLSQVCYFSYPTILSYNTEEELLFLLKSIDPDIRFLGEDYVDRKYTGKELGIPIHWIERNHGWSSTKYKKLIVESLCK
jgi:glycerol-3-phosphate cytidylyltransferase